MLYHVAVAIHVYINYTIRKYNMYRNWKPTVNDEEYENKKGNFKTYDRIVSDGIQNAKHQYYFNTFIFHKKNNIKKTWKTIGEIEIKTKLIFFVNLSWTRK